MGSRGPAPKLNAIDRKRGVKERVRVDRPAEGRPMPPGEWHPKAVRWWQRMTASAVAATWREEDYDLAERGMAFVHLLWGHVEAGESRDAVAVSKAVLDLETKLWLNPSERARQGVKADLPVGSPAGSTSSARARLRSLDGGAHAVG